MRYLALTLSLACAKAPVDTAPAGGASMSVQSVKLEPRTAECGREEPLDLNKDGRQDVVNCFRADGSLARRQSDLNNDGRFDITTFYDVAPKPNAVPQRTREELDMDFDGRLDLVENYIEGRLKDTEIDTNFDGGRDVYKEFQTDGKLVRRTLDSNGDGQPDTFEDYKDGRLDRTCRDINADGMADSESCKAEPVATP
jgi:hypothetical protein